MDLKLELVAVPVTEVDEKAWGRFVYFADPDGNRWALQELPEWSSSSNAAGAPLDA